MTTAALFLDHGVGDGRVVVATTSLGAAEDQGGKSYGEQAEDEGPGGACQVMSSGKFSGC